MTTRTVVAWPRSCILSSSGAGLHPESEDPGADASITRRSNVKKMSHCPLETAPSSCRRAGPIGPTSAGLKPCGSRLEVT